MARKEAKKPRAGKIGIVLDSTVIIRQYFMEGPIFTLFKWFLHNQPSELIIPQVVLEEIKNYFKEEANSRYDKAISAIDNLNSHLHIDIPQPVSKDVLQENCERYNNELDDLLKSLNARIIPYNDIPQEDIVRRDLARKKPFRKVGQNNDSAGYRDTLIWECILRHVAPGAEKIVLITTNKSDFHGKKANELHTNLRNDLEDLGFNPEHAFVYIDVEAFVNAHVKPLLPKIPPSEEATLADYFLQNDDVIEKHLFEYFIKNKGEVLRQLEKKSGLPFEFSWSEANMLTIREIGDFDDFRITDAHVILEDLIFVEFEFKTYFELEFFAGSYYPDVDDFLPRSVHVESYDGDVGAWLVASDYFPMQGSLTLNLVNNEVEDIEGSFRKIRVGKSCESCGAPIDEGVPVCLSCGRKLQ